MATENLEQDASEAGRTTYIISWDIREHLPHPEANEKVLET